MGRVFWILTWDKWGSGLNMINPRLVEDERGNNSFVCSDEAEKQELIKQYTAGLEYYKIID